jgi:hypothetical protein
MSRQTELQAWLEAASSLRAGQWEGASWTLRWEEDSVSVLHDGVSLEPEELVLQLSGSRVSAPPGHRGCAGAALSSASAS